MNPGESHLSEPILSYTGSLEISLALATPSYIRKQHRSQKTKLDQYRKWCHTITYPNIPKGGFDFDTHYAIYYRYGIRRASISRLLGSKTNKFQQYFISP